MFSWILHLKSVHKILSSWLCLIIAEAHVVRPFHTMPPKDPIVLFCNAIYTYCSLIEIQKLMLL